MGLFVIAFAALLASLASGAADAQSTSGQIYHFTSGPNPAGLTQPVTLDADVRFQDGEEPGPTGTMTYYDGGTPIAGCQDLPMQANGTGPLCHTSFSSAGHHSLTVSYSGDANYAATTGGPIDQVVDTGTLYYPLMSEARATVNGQIGLDLLIAAQAGHMPTGTVTFKDGILTRCANVQLAPLDANYAEAFCPPDLSFGHHKLTIEYSGDSFYRAGTLTKVEDGFGFNRVMDFDGDFQEDQLVIGDDGTVWTWTMDGLTVKSKTQQIGNARRGGVHVADFNADNRTDFLVELNDGSTWMWTNTSSGLFSFLLRQQGSGWHATHTADVNGDGKADILWRNDNGAAELWLMNGGSTLEVVPLVPPGSGWTLQLVGDFNGDLRTDLVWRNTANGSVGLWLMDGDAVLERMTIMPAGTPWMPTAVADLDTDGMADLLWTNTADGSVGAWLMNGTTAVARRTLMPANSGWTLTRVASFSGGYMNYLLWTNTNSSVGEWRMNGLDIAQHQALMPPQSGWHLTGVSYPFGAATVTWTHDNGMVGMWRVSDFSVTQRQTMLQPGSGFSVISDEAKTLAAP